MELLPPVILARQDELNAAFVALDELDHGIDSPADRAIDQRIKSMSPSDSASCVRAMDRWGGYTHGTGVADAALAGNPQAELVIARMEWWHGSPPVPCWTRELAHREAASIRDQLHFVVSVGVRVINMSWGRHEGSYRRNLEQCAPAMSRAARTALARYTVAMRRVRTTP